MAITLTLNDNTAEQKIMSALISGTELDRIFSEITENDLSSARNQLIYRLIRDMHYKGEKVDMITAVPVVTDHCGLTFQEYQAFVNAMTLPKEVPSYIDRLKKASKRKDIFHMITLAEGQLEDGVDPDEIMKGVGERVILQGGDVKRTLIKPQDMAVGCLEAVARRMDKETREKSVINTSFGSLNRSTGGFEKSDLIILSAESGAGKSAFSMNIARDVGVTQKRPCVYLNSEMSTEQQQLRWASFLSGVSHSQIRAGLLTSEEHQRIIDSLNDMHKSKLYTLNMPDMQIASLLTQIRLMQKQYGIELAIVDYIGRMDTMNTKGNAEEWQLMLNAARLLKTLAQELDIIIVMVAQLTRNGESLAQGSYMKHEADLWLNIKRWKEPGDLQENYPWNCYLEIRKARSSGTSSGLRMHFHGDTLTFTDKEDEAVKYCKDEEKIEVPV